MLDTMADTPMNVRFDNVPAPPFGSTEAVSGKVMVAVVIVLFMVILFILFLHLYARWFWNQRGVQTSIGAVAAPRRRRFVFAPSQDPLVALHRGLEPSVVRALPVVIFRSGEFKECLECAVCLSELVEGEKVRMLPKCSHGFHVECIDMWFQSHSTCPLCRSTVGPESKDSSVETQALEDSSTNEFAIENSPNFPTNVLFWGNETLVRARGLEEGSGTSPSLSPCTWTSTSSSTCQDGSLVIEIPSTSRFMEEETKSPMTSPSPMTTRLRSLRRLLSRGHRVNPPSPSAVDVELGEEGRGQSPKTSPESQR